MKLKVSPDHKFTQVYFTLLVMSFIQSLHLSSIHLLKTILIWKRYYIPWRASEKETQRPTQLLIWWFIEMTIIHKRPYTFFWKCFFLLLTPRVTTGLGNQGSNPGEIVWKEKSKRNPQCLSREGRAVLCDSTLRRFVAENVQLKILE